MQVGTVYAALTFDTSGLKQGIAEAKTAYSGLQQAGQTAFQSVAEYAASAAGQTTAALGSIGSAEEQAANKALALAQAEARLLQTQGDLAGAVARLSEGLEVGGASSARYAQAQNQLEQTQQRVSTQALQQAQAEARLAVEQGNARCGRGATRGRDRERTRRAECNHPGHDSADERRAPTRTSPETGPERIARLRSVAWRDQEHAWWPWYRPRRAADCAVWCRGGQSSTRTHADRNAAPPGRGITADL